MICVDVEAAASINGAALLKLDSEMRHNSESEQFRRFLVSTIAAHGSMNLVIRFLRHSD